MTGQYLVTGTTSGLGSFLCKTLSADYYDRERERPVSHGGGERLEARYDLIVHAAFGFPKGNESFSEYVDYQLNLVRQLIQYEHNKFLFLSTVDVYRSPAQLTPYARAKLLVEKEVLRIANNPIVLRTGSLLGPGMRPNQLIRVATGDQRPLSLAPASTFSLLLYDQIIEKLSILNAGLNTLICQPLISLQQIADHFGTSPNWGEFTYETPIPKGVGVMTERTTSEHLMQMLASFVSRRGWELTPSE